MAARTVEYRWRLAELMAAAGMHNSTDLVPSFANVESTCQRLRYTDWWRASLSACLCK